MIDKDKIIEILNNSKLPKRYEGSLDYVFELSIPRKNDSLQNILGDEKFAVKLSISNIDYLRYGGG